MRTILKNGLIYDGTTDDPRIDYVFVNGEALLKDGQIQPGAQCGRAIRV